MRCEDAVDAIQEVMKGAGTPMELARRLPAAVHDHLQRCSACRDAAHDLLSLDRALEGLAEVEAPPPALLSSVMSAVNSGPLDYLQIEPAPRLTPEELGLLPRRRPVGLAAAACVLVLLAAGLLGTLDVQGMWQESPLASWMAEVMAIDLSGVGETLTGWMRMDLPVGAQLPPLIASIAALAVLGCAVAVSWRLCARPQTVRVS